MTRRLQQELQQKRPFDSIEEEVAVEIQRTAQVLSRNIAETLKPFGITPSQFNVLRILRGARPEALSAGVICERMIAFDPDLTRLLDRLEDAGWVQKSRSTTDRRVVLVSITPEGTARVEDATRAARASIVASLRPLGADRLETIADLLEAVRASAQTTEAGATPATMKPRAAKNLTKAEGTTTRRTRRSP